MTEVNDNGESKDSDIKPKEEEKPSGPDDVHSGDAEDGNLEESDVKIEEFDDNSVLDRTFAEKEQEESNGESSEDSDIVKVEPMPASGLSSEFENRYRVLGRIGAGGMGTVFDAEHIVLKRRIALKVLNRLLAQEPVSITRFSREASACAALTHPNLVQIYDCGLTTNGAPFLVMEYVPGESLETLIKEKKGCDLSTFFNIFIPISEALEFAHQKGVVHRDLKPDNIILTKDESGAEQVKLIDFGIAKVEEMGGQLQLLTHTGELLGTPNYMSPEQCRGLEVDGRSDIYALGCVMYEALSGKVAFRGHSAVAVIYQQIETDAKNLAELEGLDSKARTLAPLVMKCLEKDPENRFQSMSELARELEKYRKKLGMVPVAEGEVYGKPVPLAKTLLIAAAFSIVSVAAFAMFCSGKGMMSDGAIQDDSQKTTARIAAASLIDHLGLKSDSRTIYQSLVSTKSNTINDPLTRVYVALIVMNQYTEEGKWNYIRQLFDSISDDLKSLEKTKTDGVDLIPLAYRYYANALRMLDNKKEADSNGLYAIELADRVNSPDWLKANLEHSYAIGLFKGGRYKKALEHFKKSAGLLEKLPDSSEIKVKELVDDCSWILWSCQAIKNSDTDVDVDWVAEGGKYLLRAINITVAAKEYDEAARLSRLLTKHLGNYQRWNELANLRKQLSELDELSTAAMAGGVFTSKGPLHEHYNVANFSFSSFELGSGQMAVSSP